MKSKMIFAAAAVVLSIGLFYGEAIGETTAGRVLAVRKNVEVVRGDERQNAIPRMDLLLKDAVETDRESRTKLFFSDDSILNLGELSKVVVEEYLYSPEKQKSKSIYRLVDGTLKVVVGRSDLEIHTSTAVVASRGTEIVAWEEKQKKRSCAMSLDGDFVIKNRDPRIKGEEEVPKGTYSCVPHDGPPLKKHEVNPAVLKIAALTAVIGETSGYSLRSPLYFPAGLTKGVAVRNPQQQTNQQPQLLPPPPPPPPPQPPPPPPPRRGGGPPPSDSPPATTDVTITFDLGEE